jgi:Ca2+-transporting ATPase
MQLMVIYVPFFNDIFQTSPLEIHELLVCFLLPLVVFVLVELEKLAAGRGWIYDFKRHD